MQEFDSRIERALDTYPLAPLPAGFVHRTMQRLPAARPRFRLDFLDIALPFFLSMFMVSLALAGLWMIRLVNPSWLQIMQIRLAWLTFYAADRIGNPLPLYGLSLLAILALALLAAAGLLLQPPAYRPSR